MDAFGRRESRRKFLEGVAGASWELFRLFAIFFETVPQPTERQHQDAGGRK